MAARARLTVLQPPPAGGGKVAAVGPTDRAGVFVALVPGIGFRYLDLSGEPPGHWSTAGGYGGAVTGEFGLHHRHGGHDAAACVSVVESPPRAWVCLRIPAIGETVSVDEAAVVERTVLGADAVAVAACFENSGARGPGDGAIAEEAALVLGNGAVRFLDLTTGKPCGKSVKLEGGAGGGTVAACGLGARRAAVVRQGGEFFVVELDTEQRRALIKVQGKIGGAAGSPLLSRQLLGVAAAGEQDRVLLCWEGRKSEAAFASAALDGVAPQLQQLVGAGAGGALATWLGLGGYVAQFAQAGDEGALHLAVRDARFGMLVASEAVPLPGKRAGAWLACTSGDTSLLADSRGADVAAVRWALPPFSLQLVIGAAEARGPASEHQSPLAALHEAAAGKRALEDSAVEELFSAKRFKATDEALAAEVSRRAVALSEGLVDLVARRRCWASAVSLLSLPELDEAAATQLLAADRDFEACLLASAVRRPSTPRLLESALAERLPASLLPGIVELLVEWLETYRHCTAAEVAEVAPGVPTPAEILRFLVALADGCLPSLLRLGGDLLERAVEEVTFLAREAVRTERLAATVHAAARLGADGRERRGAEPAVEAVLVDF